MTRNTYIKEGRMKNIDPTKYNLHSRIKLLGKDERIFIVIDRKSRIIMKDGHRIIKIAKQINQVEVDKEVSVLSGAPVCKKTKQFLLENHIVVKSL